MISLDITSTLMLLFFFCMCVCFIRHDDPEIFERKVDRVIHSKQLRQLCAMVFDYTFYFVGRLLITKYLLFCSLHLKATADVLTCFYSWQ